MSDVAIDEDLLNKAATVTRPTYNDDGSGGDTEILMIHPSDPLVNIRYYAASGSNLIVAARDDELINHIAYVLPSVSIVRDDRLFMDDKRFDVVAVLAPSKAHHLKLQIEEVHGVYIIAQTKAGFNIHTKDDDGNETVLEVKNW